jgi:ADP-heptose:LPS heptosyltransferase
MALGDVLLATPIAQALAEQGHSVSASSKYTDVWQNNPYIVRAHQPQHIEPAYFDRIVNLDLAYELKPNQHIITSYSQTAGVELQDLKPQLYANHQDTLIAKSLRPQQPYVVMHCRNDAWPSRNLPKQFWQTIASNINYPTVVVGSGSDLILEDCLDLRNRLNIQQLKVLIEHAQAFIGVDSAPMHIANTTMTPTIGLFTNALSKYRQPLWAKPWWGIDTPLTCGGCLHRRPAPVTEYACERLQPDCINSFDPDKIINIIGSIC